MSRVTVAFIAAATLVALAATPICRASAPTTLPVSEFDAKVQPLLEKYCYECHGDGMDSGDLAMDDYKSLAEMRKDVKVWQKVLQYARTRTMPPPKSDQPTDQEREQLVESLHRELYEVDPANPDPGRITIRRLNRSEYRNTIRDLIGVSFDPTIDFPQDDTGYGFDNIADVLTLPPMLMEKYFAATERILNQAIPTDKVESRARTIRAVDATPSFKRTDDRVRDGWVMLSSAQDDALTLRHESPAPGDYVVRVLAHSHYAEEPGPGEPSHRPVKLSVMLNDVVVRLLDVEAQAGDPKWYEARVGVPAGTQQFRVAVRRERGPMADRESSNGRLGREQSGSAMVKEILIDGPVSGAVRRIRPNEMELSENANTSDNAASLTRTDATATATFDVPADGKYLLRAQAYADYAGNEPAQMELSLDGKPLKVFDVTAPSYWKSSPIAKDLPPPIARAVPQVYEVQVELARGARKLSARFVNNLREPDAPDPNYRDRNIHLQNFEVVELAASPLSPPMTEPMRTLFAKYTPAKDAAPDAQMAQARALLADFTRRAWRRPLKDDELARIMRLYQLASDNGMTFRAAVKHAMTGVLLSSSFLFRGEPTPAVVADANGATARAAPIGEIELASRLSYFLWSTTPDEELLALAERGELRKNLAPQVKRMLASKKADALVENFAGQWLQFRNLDAVHPDRKLFKTYNDRLRDSMIRETQLFFTHILRQDRSLMDVLTADYTFVNDQLAKHYGFKGEFKGNEFKKVSLEGTSRRGVITQGSVLTITSNPTRTSPVKRGKWVLENLLASPPPPPPADVPALEDESRQLKGTLRQRFEQHRESKGCASCHAPLDPIGFGLENFDPVGAWRDKDHGEPVDAASAFVNGPTFTGAIELIDLLAKTRQKDFYRSVSEAALTFALGRGVEPYDQPAVDRIVRDLQANDGRFSSLIFGVIDSVPFQMRRAETSSNAAQASADGIR